ncbi:MAG: M23 family metallopeptidase [Paludibacter sp.]|jgi:murein DD-endopeptidase MepM/ murein hydrolase activator NlpD|nr:M23 family metallopeptidase [Paludibacter sp.]
MAKKHKYHFNNESLNYEPIRHNFAYYAKQVLVHLFSGVSLGVIFFIVFEIFLESPQEKQLAVEKSRVQAQYKVLERQLEDVQSVLLDLEQRDNNLYRVILQAEPIPDLVRRSIIRDNDYYKQMLSMTNSQITVATTQKMEEIRKQLYVQSKSYNNLVELFKDRENMLECIPAIQPVLNKDLTRMASGYGYRMHPVYHIQKFHEGMDFSSPTGTEIYATGNGVVVLSDWKQGYGNCIEINHGYGYLTRYAHLSKINVRNGQKVKRGDVIGLVGNTGLSVGPHLHYEVHLRDKVMNPMNYYFIDLSLDEYDRMVQMSNNMGKTLD